MSGKQAFEKKLEALRTLRYQPKSEELLVELRKTLADKSNYVVSKAAEIAADTACNELLPELLTAFDYFLDDAIKRDPQCWAKNAVIKALKTLGCTDPAVYIRGLKHFQPEPAYGGSQDTAATLRGECGHALVQCYALDEVTILGHLVDLLADPEHSARIDAASAIGNIVRPESALILRTKIHCGDARAEVMGAAMAAYLSTAPPSETTFVAKFLTHADEDVRYEAAAALGQSKNPEAFQALKQCYATTRDPRFRTSVLVSIGASLRPEAIDYLTSLIQPDNLSQSKDAIKALQPARYREEVYERVERATRATGSDTLIQTFQKIFKV